MNKNKIIGYILGILSIIILWEVLAARITIFPSIKLIMYNISTNLVDKLVILPIVYTIFHAFIAFIISLLIGLITANLAYKFKTINYILQPLVSLLRSIPTISVIIIVIMIVKLELITYLITFIITYPIIHQTIYLSLEKIDKELILINRMDNTNSFKNYFYFFLPMSYHGIINAIMQTFGLSIKIQIMSELLIGSTNLKGIGVLLSYYKSNLELDNVFSITFIIIIIVFLIELLLKSLLKRLENLT